MEVVLKKFSSFVLGIACSSFVGIDNASTNAFLDLHILSQLLVSFGLSLLLYVEERYTFTTYIFQILMSFPSVMCVLLLVS